MEKDLCRTHVANFREMLSDRIVRKSIVFETNAHRGAKEVLKFKAEKCIQILYLSS